MLSNFTVNTRETFIAGAFITVGSCVLTDPTIQTWMMSATIIQIFVTQNSSPVHVTVTAPG